MTGFRRVRRRVVAALVGAAVLVSLSGCWVADLADLVPTPGPTPSGHADQLSREEAAALIEQVPGIHSVVVGSGMSGFSSHTELKLFVDDAVAVEQPEVLEFLFAVAWATTFGDPRRGAVHLYAYQEGSGTLLKLQPQVNSLFGSEATDVYFLSALVGSDILEERWGPWPGAIPEVPVVATPAPE
jgi:hypothetical protein